MRWLLLLLISVSLIACQTTRKSKKQEVVEYPRPKTDYKGMRTLVDHLRRVPSVEIRSNANGILVLIRGLKSFSGDNSPLYVVDGAIIGRNYYHAASAADRFMIEKVEVLTPPRAGKYGAMGQNGVIEITTRQSN